MKTKLRKIGTLLLVLAVLASSVGVGAAAIAWDTETTTTSTTSDVDGSTTSIDVYYGDSGNSTYFEVDGATTSNLTLEITPSQDGVDYVAYENTTADTVYSTNGHYAFNVSHDELASAPRDVDGASYDVRIINQSSGDEVLNSTGVTFSQAGSSPKAVMVLTNDTTDSGAAMTPLVADRLSISKESASWGAKLNPLSDENETVVSTWSGYTTVDGTNTTVEVLLDNSSSATAYSDAAADYEDGDWIKGATLFANGVPHKVYKNEAPEDADGSTVVYLESSDKLVINTEGEDYQDVRTLQLRGGAGNGYAFGELWSNFGVQAALSSLIP